MSMVESRIATDVISKAKLMTSGGRERWGSGEGGGGERGEDWIVSSHQGILIEGEVSVQLSSF
jgi:hypothetical protein